MTDTPPTDAPPQDSAATGALATLRHHLIGILDATRDRPVAHLRLAFSGAEVELAWPATPSTDPPTDPPTVPSTDPPATPPTVSGHAVAAPLVGTFYAAPAPGEKPFVQVGDYVVAGQQLGILEAMKLMNRIDADVAGHVAMACVIDGTPVEYGQELFVIIPETS
ncbi:biotin/lipoyl-containing protein [Nonomuraea sp. NPDC049129]|uniref:acetyl-CoA carboxylase biotin carboxyl carrier protein n=1 Tax=Nonomuraea sp. NPDC049129 TaxID=3155272 RepID=UPI0033D2B12E